MAWIYLGIAGALEIVWVLGLKYTHGFTRLWPSVITGAAMAATYYFLALSVRTIPLGTAYAIWTGIGTVGAAVAGVLLFKEPTGALRLACIALIATGVLGLKLATPDKPAQESISVERE